jgi:acyl-CoA oxidase
MEQRVDERTRALQAKSTALIAPHAPDPSADLAAERQRASFDPLPLTYALNGGKERVERRCAALRCFRGRGLVLLGTWKPPRAPARTRTRTNLSPISKLITKNSAELARMLAATPWGDKSRRYFLTREEEYVGGLRAALAAWRHMADNGLPMEDGLDMRALLDWPSGLELHIGVRVFAVVVHGCVCVHGAGVHASACVCA